jgi:hypothetical protein
VCCVNVWAEAPAKNGDLYVAISQSAVDKVLTDANYPITLIDHWWPDYNGTEFKNIATPYTQPRRAALLQWASAHAKSEGQEGKFAAAINSTQAAAEAELDRVTNMIAEAKKTGQAWSGPSAQEIVALKQRGLEFVPYLKYIKVNVPARPVITISGDPIVVRNLNVIIDVIGQLYANMLQFRCTHYIGPICVGGEFFWGWVKAFEIDLNDVHVKIEAAIHPVVDALTIVAVPEVTLLRLDYFILRDIPLERFVNPVISQKRFLLVDAIKLTAVVPYVNTNYHISSIRISGMGELRVDVDVSK